MAGGTHGGKHMAEGTAVDHTVEEADAFAVALGGNAVALNAALPTRARRAGAECRGSLAHRPAGTAVVHTLRDVDAFFAVIGETRVTLNATLPIRASSDAIRIGWAHHLVCTAVVQILGEVDAFVTAFGEPG